MRSDGHGRSGKGSHRGGSARSRSNSPPNRLPAFAKFGSGKLGQSNPSSAPAAAYQIAFGNLPNDRGKAGLWTGHDLVLPTLGLPLDPLLDTIKEQEFFPDTAGTRPNLHSFPFQWWSVSRLRPLLSVLPSSRQQVLLHCKQYGVPPVLRRQVWTALLGVDVSAEVDPAEVYHRLLSQPCQVDMQGSYSDAQSLRDPLLTSPEGRRRLHDVVHAALNANPSFVHAQRMQVIAGPVVALFFNDEAMAFHCFQKMLNNLLQDYFQPESGEVISRSVKSFANLLAFCDPLLALHLGQIGLRPEQYVLPWVMLLFAEHFPLQQVFVLWDYILVQPPQFILFVVVLLVHGFREAILGMTSPTHARNFLMSIVQLVDVRKLIAASIKLFDLTPFSISLPEMPKMANITGYLAPEVEQFRIASSSDEDKERWWEDDMSPSKFPTVREKLKTL